MAGGEAEVEMDGVLAVCVAGVSVGEVAAAVGGTSTDAR